ncbi:MAG: tRNA lysidine(34) synthetase TilS, partial [Planctomycetota bacterium]
MHPLPCGRILLAFSGGPDSVGLAAALGGAEVLLAYADHRLRGAAQARRERARVAAAAHRLRRPLVRTRLRCGAGEGGARRARYRALHALARKHGCATLAPAHTADALAETVLLQLLRGTGPRGLASLRPAARLGGLLRIRPALDERRDALRARGAGIPTVEDPTNRLLQGERARVRALLLPALGVLLGGDPVPPLCALAAGAAGMRATLERRAQRLSRRAGRRRLLAEPAPTFP